MTTLNPQGKTMKFIICSTCSLHHYASEDSCPHCGHNREMRLTKRRVRPSALALLMGSSSVDFGNLHPLPAIELPEQSEGDWTGQAVERRPEVGGAEAQSRAAREMEIDAVLQFLPAFALNGSWNWTDSPAGFDSSQSSWWVGLGASLPLWDGGLLVHGARDAQ